MNENFILIFSFLNVSGEFYLPSISDLGTGLYAGVWAYNGWNKLNMITEEIIDPEKNLLIAIVAAVGLIILFYRRQVHVLTHFLFAQTNRHVVTY